MTDERPPTRSARRSPAALLVAAAVLLLAGAAGVTMGVDQRLTATPPPPPATSLDRLVETDLGALGEAATRATLAQCLRPEDPDVEEVVTARRLTDGQEPFRFVLYRNADDQVVTCSRRLNGPTYAGERRFRPTRRHPVVAVGGMAFGSWLPDQSTSAPRTATAYATAQLFAAGKEVAGVQLRVVVDGSAGPWFVGDVHDGFAFVPLFAAGPVPLDGQGSPQVRFERRAFDRSGRPVAVRS